MTSTGKENPENFIIRPFRRGEFEEVSGLWDVTGMGSSKRGDDETIILSSIEMGGNLLIMEEKNSGKIVGTSWMTFDGRRIHLHHFGILPAYQERGLADILLSECLRFVKEKGYQVKLEVNTSNYKAINLYKKHGFEYLGDFDVYIIRDITKIR